MDDLLVVLKKKTEELKCADVIMDYTARNGRVCDAYVAQFDLDIGLTIMGEDPWHEGESRLYCINKAVLMSRPSGYIQYLQQMQEAVERLESGVWVAPAPDGSGQVACAF